MWGGAQCPRCTAAAQPDREGAPIALTVAAPVRFGLSAFGPAPLPKIVRFLNLLKSIVRATTACQLRSSPVKGGSADHGWCS